MIGARARLARAGWLAAAAVVGLAGVAGAQPARLPSHDAHGPNLEATPPEIEVATFGIGERIFEKFGHAALCLRYHEPAHPEVCFNYGVTNFDAGASMVWSFLRNQQRFWVEPTSLRSMVGFYMAEDRDIWVQTLAVEPAAAREIEARLWSDIEEAHRYYLYDHFFDNCTTRLRDIIDHATHGALRAGNDVPGPVSFREIGRQGLAELPVLLVGSDLIAGRTIDDHPTGWEAMFYPELFRQQLAARFHAPPRQLYKRLGPPFATTGPSGRLGLLAIGLAFAVPLVIAQWRRRLQRAALAWLTVELVVLGLLVWGLVIVSPIPAVRYNEAVLVVMPLDAVLPWLGAVRRRRYALARLAGLVAVSLLAALGVLHQPLGALIAIVFLPMAVIALDLPRGLARAPAAAPPAAS